MGQLKLFGKSLRSLEMPEIKILNHDIPLLPFYQREMEGRLVIVQYTYAENVIVGVMYDMMGNLVYLEDYELNTA